MICDEDFRLYTNNTGRKSFQWELWQYCNSLCDFCYLGEDNRIHNKERQLQSMLDLNQAIDHMDFSVYNNISLIGGEFFQGQLDDPEIHDKFFEIITKIFQLYVDKKIGSMWITCTLTLGDQKHLYELLDLAEKMGVHPVDEYGSSGIWLCTSWDAKGRFHTPKMKENWEFHMKNIKKKYPWIKFNTTIILQQAFVDMYLEGKFRAYSFMEEYNTTIFFKQCGIPTSLHDKLEFPDGIEITDDLIKLASKKKFNEDYFAFYPTRDSFLLFLEKFYIEDNESYDRLFNIRYRSDELHRNFLQDECDKMFERYKGDYGMEETGVKLLPCGHSDVYTPYIDSQRCCLCDRNVIAESLDE